VEVEWLILADAAQVTGGKLYLLGGGWDRLTVSVLGQNQSMAIAVSFRVPWTQTNEKHNFEIELVTEDGTTITRVPGQFEVGRPTGLAPGQDQRAQIVVNVHWTITETGIYVVNARLDGQEGQRFPFTVVAGAIPPGSQARAPDQT